MHSLLLNEVARGEEAESFYNRLMDLETALNGKTVRGDPYRHSDIVLGKFKRYFNVHVEERTISLTRRKNAISQAVNRFGKIILIASKRMEWDEMLSIYKEREGIERQYRCLKTELEA
ncbi:MAG: transposase, partial [Deltaproteobacteria bacterium]|nr:transposase [Deltaproteobacteria bacterium]